MTAQGGKRFGAEQQKKKLKNTYHCWGYQSL